MWDLLWTAGLLWASSVLVVLYSMVAVHWRARRPVRETPIVLRSWWTVGGQRMCVVLINSHVHLAYEGWAHPGVLQRVRPGWLLKHGQPEGQPEGVSDVGLSVSTGTAVLPAHSTPKQTNTRQPPSAEASRATHRIGSGSCPSVLS